MNDEIVKRLISRIQPRDAVASYYAYSCQDSRIVTKGSSGDAAVFVEAQGRLGPVGLLRADGVRPAIEVLAHATPGERYLMAPWALRRAVLDGVLARDPSRNQVFWMAALPREMTLPAEFVCDVEGTGVRIRREGVDVASCVCIWQSPRFAEVQVSTVKGFRRRGLARVAVGTVGRELIQSGITPLYVTAADNAASVGLAGALDLEATAEDEFAATVAFSG